jgi:hypothetical protein
LNVSVIAPSIPLGPIGSRAEKSPFRKACKAARSWRWSRLEGVSAALLDIRDSRDRHRRFVPVGVLRRTRLGALAELGSTEKGSAASPAPVLNLAPRLPAGFKRLGETESSGRSGRDGSGLIHGLTIFHAGALGQAGRDCHSGAAHTEHLPKELLL